MVQQLFNKSAYEGTTMVAINSLCNMVGRIAFSTMSDYVGRRPMFVFCLMVQIAMIYGILAAIHAGAYSVFLFCVFFAGMCYGAGFGLIPAFLADMFGAKYTGATHGFILTAWSFDGVVGGLIFTAVYNNYLVKVPNTTQINPISYDVDFYWVSAIVMLAFLVTTFFLRTDLTARFLPYRNGEWLRSRLFGRLYLVGSFGFKAVTKEEETAWWSDYLTKAQRGDVIVGKLLNGGRPKNSQGREQIALAA
jgi:MFS family permease